MFVVTTEDAMYPNKPHPITTKKKYFIRLSRLACLHLEASISSALGGTKPVFTSTVLDALDSTEQIPSH